MNHISVGSEVKWLSGKDDCFFRVINIIEDITGELFVEVIDRPFNRVIRASDLVLA